MNFPPEIEMDSPAVIMHRLNQIEHDLALRQLPYEQAAANWYKAQRAIKKAYATALLSSCKASVTAQKAEADLAALLCDGVEYEAEYEALKAAISVMDKRAMICATILKAQGRA